LSDKRALLISVITEISGKVLRFSFSGKAEFPELSLQ
jgi:hypothetical protein